VALVARGGGVDEELAVVGDAAGGEDLPVDAPAAAVLAVARPGDEEVAAGVHRHGRVDLVAGRGGVDEELAALGHPGGVVALRVDAHAVAVLTGAGPGHGEVAVDRVDRHGGVALVAGSEGVDAELTPLGRAGRVVALGEDAEAAAVLPAAGPGDHEIALRVH